MPICIVALHKIIEEYYIKKYLKASKDKLTIENQRKAERKAFLASIPVFVSWILILFVKFFKWIGVL